MIGETEAPIIEIEAHTPIPLGVAVILTEPFPSSLTLEQGNSLANMLAEKGWNVVISPFHLPMSTTNEQKETTTESMASATEEMPSSQLDSIHPRSNQLTQHLNFESTTTALSLQLNAINNYLQDRAGYRMVIAQGMLATAYLSATMQQPQLHPDTLVTISPFWPEEATNAAVIDYIAESEFPVLDLSLDGFNDWAEITAPKRKISAKNALKMHYRQIIIPSNLLAFSIKRFEKPPHIQIVANNTIGWTRHLGW